MAGYILPSIFNNYSLKTNTIIGAVIMLLLIIIAIVILRETSTIIKNAQIQILERLL